MDTSQEVEYWILQSLNILAILPFLPFLQYFEYQRSFLIVVYFVPKWNEVLTVTVANQRHLNRSLRQSNCSTFQQIPIMPELQ